ncbi:hypothetical protein QCA50_020686 [Cerrena zonata]|uniref:Uncharacterized protein n=1 Tax=Cerrena zonata TaxID=2478898 RepID=A0AAW0FI85_9APHY
MEGNPDLIAQAALLAQTGQPAFSFTHYPSGQPGGPYMGQPAPPGFYAYPNVYQGAQLPTVSAPNTVPLFSTGITNDEDRPNKPTKRGRRDHSEDDSSPRRSRTRDDKTLHPKFMALLERLQSDVLSLRQLIKDNDTRTQDNLHSAVDFIEGRIHKLAGHMEEVIDTRFRTVSDRTHPKSAYSLNSQKNGGKGQVMNRFEPNKPKNQNNQTNALNPLAELSQWAVLHPNDLGEASAQPVVGEIIKKTSDALKPPGWNCSKLEDWVTFHRQHPTFRLWGVPVATNHHPSMPHLLARNVAKAYAPSRTRGNQSYFKAFSILFVQYDWSQLNQLLATTYTPNRSGGTTVERFPLANDEAHLLITSNDIMQHLVRCGIRDITYPAYQAIRLFSQQWLADYQVTTTTQGHPTKGLGVTTTSTESTAEPSGTTAATVPGAILADVDIAMEPTTAVPTELSKST